MHHHFKPFENEADVIRLGGLELENRLDRVSLSGELVLTKDLAGLALAKELQSLIGQVLKALEAQSQLPQSIEIQPAQTVKNPFA
ncbi:hypothetical protein SAMN05216344_1079 [Polaromonas sp. OV174]|uniref:hypothetical protein n=1 Tax=Polaromonas sp. OV174 TaxID=1855300 RepID=UPI0008EADABE|nr:hypothetical protein [Polaromonas sp. OV174]SFC00177.1 hypothetical protein SAMN05216344_1079 [Polaromonas sp. OV174]